MDDQIEMLITAIREQNQTIKEQNQTIKEQCTIIGKSNKRKFIIIITLVFCFTFAAVSFFNLYFNYSWKQSQTLSKDGFKSELKTGGD